MTAKTVRNLAVATLFFAACLLSGCAEQPSQSPPSDTDNAITPEYSPRDGGEGGGGSTQTCVLSGLTPDATYKLS